MARGSQGRVRDNNDALRSIPPLQLTCKCDHPCMKRIFYSKYIAMCLGTVTPTFVMTCTLLPRQSADLVNSRRPCQPAFNTTVSVIGRWRGTVNTPLPSLHPSLATSIQKLADQRHFQHHAQASCKRPTNKRTRPHADS